MYQDYDSSEASFDATFQVLNSNQLLENISPRSEELEDIISFEELISNQIPHSEGV